MVLRFSYDMMRVIRDGNFLSVTLVSFTNPTNPGLTSLDLRKLLDETLATCTCISCFGSAMFQLTLGKKTSEY